MPRQAVGRLQTDDAAVGGRNAHGSPGVGPQRAGAQPRGDRRARSARRPAGSALRIPGVAHGTGVRERRCRAVRELVHVELADDDGAGLLQPRHDLGVLVRHAIREHGARGGRQHPRRVDVVLERDRNPVQRSAPPPAGELRLELPRPGRGALAGHGDVGIEARIDAADPLEVGLHQLRRRQRAGANEPLGPADAQRRGIGGLRERGTAQRERGRRRARRQELAPIEVSRHVTSCLRATRCRGAPPGAPRCRGVRSLPAL